MIKKKLLGQLLLEQRWVAESHIQQALQQQEGSHLKIGKILVKNQVLTEEKLCEALSLQLDLPYQKTLRVENVEFLPEQVSLSFLKENFMLPLKCANGVLYVATADPLNVQPLDALGAIFGKQARPVLSTEAEIEQAIYLFFQQNSEIPGSVLDDLEGEDRAPGAGKADDLLNLANEAPIIKLVNLIISQAVKEHASDVHIEPFEKKLRVRFRIDGLLYEILTPPKEYQAAIASRIKIMSQLNIAETRLPQDGKMSLKVAGKDIDIRVSVFPTAFGERIVLRLLNKTDLDFDLQNLGFAPETLERFRCVLKKPHGILLVTGPTGSGKSTTLYAALKTLNQSERNILTIEDPIEYQIAGVGQTQVKPSIGLTFAAGLRAILRQDPDVIMVGEIRDLETARIAIRAALTGHLVLSTLHTNDAASAAVRLIEMGVAAYLVASSVVGILAQRLVRVICPHCKAPYQPEPELLLELGLDGDNNEFYRGQGCEHCFNTGFQGRKGIFEFVEVDAEVRRLVLESRDADRVKKQTVQRGMVPLRQDGLHKALQGITTLDEVMRVAYVDL